MSNDTPTNGAVCQLVDPALVAEIVGEGEVKTTGPGAVSREARKTGVSHCSITAADARQPVIQVRLGDVNGDPERWRTTLKGEAEKAGVPVGYEDESWYGYARDHTSGMYNPGSSLNVVTDEHVIRVTIYKWSDSTHDARVDLAEKIARSAEENQAAFDEKS
jgi:hypothetical protein|nr:hypothetical protein [Aeromicrobium sp.]